MTSKTLTLRLHKWKHLFLKNQEQDIVLRELFKIVDIKKDCNFYWFTRPQNQPPLHLSIFFKRWEIAFYLLTYENGLYVNPYHRNNYNESILDMLTNEEPRTEIITKCIFTFEKLLKQYCSRDENHGILCLGRYCPQCKSCEISSDSRIHLRDQEETEPEWA